MYSIELSMLLYLILKVDWLSIMEITIVINFN
jgi:hypothetical protein